MPKVRDPRYDEPVAVWNKLVRDGIPNYLEQMGKKSETHILDEDAYVTALRNKLREEVTEYLENPDIEELADLLEVVHALAKTHGVTFADVEAVRASQHAERGGFEQRIWLERVING